MTRALILLLLCLVPAHARAGDVASFYGFESGGAKLRVTYAGRSVVVRINDRGPFIRGRTKDLSIGAARAIGLTARGVGPVTLERL